MKRKGLIFLLVSFLILIAVTSCGNSDADIISTGFAGYDFARAVVKDTDLSVKMLLKPGQESHSYEPSATDIKSILHAKVFIYIGGESDTWVEDEILKNAESDLKIINMFDVLKDDLLFEEGEEDEYDEHVWLNPENAIKIIEAIKDTLKEMGNNDLYDKNANEYVEKLKNTDTLLQNLHFDKTLVIADRFPLLYFVKRYDISYVAALGGCSSSSDTSAKKIREMVSVCESEQIPVIFTIELSSQNIANTVVKEVKQDEGRSMEIKTFYTMQNVSEEDYKSGLTYSEMLNKNYEALKLLKEA